MKKMQEQTIRTVALAVTGFAALLAVVPDWARGGLVVFAGIYAVMVLALDSNLKHSVRLWLGPRLHGDDIKKAGAKSPAGRRAAT